MEPGKNQTSLTDIREQLTSVFEGNSNAVKNADGVPVIPGSELPAIMAELSSRYGVDLMSAGGVQALKEFLENNPDVEVTPAHLLTLVAAIPTPSSDDPAPQDDPRSDSSGASSPDPDHLKGRGEISTPHRPPPRTPSNMSLRSNANTPGRAAPPSPFDSQMRQRTIPLSNQAPSSWTRKPLPASRRRKSDAGSSGNRSSSDNESSPAISRSSRRKSGPLSPKLNSRASMPFPPPSSFLSSVMSPDSSFSSARRTQSFDHSLAQTLVDSFPTHTDKSKTSPTNPSLQFSSDSETEPEDVSEDENTHRYVRQALSSDASLEPQDVVEALQKANTELSRKNAESERRMQNRLAERETEIAELEAQLDDLKNELSISKREEKELRIKERGNMTQLATLESEIQKLQKGLEHHKTQYSNMQKKYHEQCTETERMRNALRRKEQEIKEADDRAFAHEAETQKWARERETLEQSIETLEAELITTRHASNELDEQKQENLLLKETIDRLRFDLDALRAGMTSNVGGQNQGPGTLSRSLANEIKEGFERREREEREREKEEEEEEADSEVIVEETEGSEDGYIETTITTTRKRTGKTKPTTRLLEGTLREYADAETQHDPSEFVTSSSTQHDASWVNSSMGVQHDAAAFTATSGVQYDRELFTSSEGTQYDASLHTFSEGIQCDRTTFTSTAEVQYDSRLFTSSEGVQHQAKEFSTQAGVQHDPAAFVSATGVQHDAAIGSVGTEVQTEERVLKTVQVETAPDVSHAQVGTEVEVEHTEPTPERTMCEAEIQTEQDVQLSVPSPVPSDLPPPYAQAPRETEAGVLKKWHAGLTERASTPTPSSSQVREEWAALKRSAGVECGVIDRIVEGKAIIEGEGEGDEVTEWVRVPVKGNRRGLFNVYNTYIVRRGEGWWTSVLTQAVVGIGFWAIVAGLWGPRLTPFEIPTYTDRATWSAYNNYAGAFGEGLVGRSVDNPVWVAIERLVVGAAVRVGPGMPT
ncbi:unnamed protein product [Rhizoctonia solani]|uniref:Uncharacterized protein n=1 Tax=Rhizoctonia solani TaxID=456999 RepID=A0A8H2XLI1_9AGAM|nr:unnamed protein product [Rhizoctonia solani]CAE6428376.1 unnamed protein product [Rhizoctonia solani]